MPHPQPVTPGPEFSSDDLARYSRQVILPELGLPGQARLGAAKVLVVGAGGLGSPALLYLAAAGVGTIGILDSDDVELSNLHRQVVHSTDSVGRSKVDSAAATIAAINPGVQVIRHLVRLDEQNADHIVPGYDVVLDGTDNFETRYVVNDACARAGIPLVWGAVLGFAAQIAVFWAAAPGGVQLRDLFPHPPAPGTVPSCAEAGVVGAVCGQAGSIMAGEAIKLITGIGEPLLGRVLVIDALRGRWDQIPLEPSQAASAEPARPTASRTPSPAAAPQARTAEPQALADDGSFRLDVRTPEEFAQGHLDGSINVPLPVLLAGGGPLPGAEQGVLVICRTGPRAEVAAAALRARGYVDVRVLEGGLLRLSERGASASDACSER
jgi:molybdopterin/thiamine biosynthesis adenylyltransferase/rhodanese-related sulfurtransferase